jgi:hypothetical protein
MEVVSAMVRAELYANAIPYVTSFDKYAPCIAYSVPPIMAVLLKMLRGCRAGSPGGP